MAKSTDSPASGHPRPAPSHRTVSQPRRPRRLKRVASSAGGPESSGRLTAEMSSLQALMDLALPRFAMAEGSRQVHPPWSVMSESPALPTPSQIELRGGEDSRCSMDQTSISSVYLNLDALSSSSDKESLDVKKCEDFAVTIVCSSEEAGTRVNSEEVLSDKDFPAVFGARDIRQVVRRCANPPGSHTSRTARMDSRQEPPAPAVDLVTGKYRPGKVSRTVSTSPLVLDLTVMCTPGTEVLQPGAAAQGVLPPGTMANAVAAIDTSTPAVATPAPVVRQPELMAKEFPTLRSPDLLPSFGLSSSSSSPTLPWGTAEDSSPPISPNRVRERHSQDVPDEGSLFNVSPLSPQLVVRPTRGSGAAPSEGVLLPTMLEDFDYLVLGDPISYARFEQFPGSESSLSLPVYAWPPSSAFFDGLGCHSVCVGSGEVRPAGGGDLEIGPSYSDGGGQVVRDRTAGLSVPILGVRRTPVCRWKPGIWLAAASSSLSGAGGSSGVGPTAGLFTNSWAKNRRWWRLSTYNGMQVLCCQIYRYCPSLLWQ